jgi:hypothetical protein
MNGTITTAAVEFERALRDLGFSGDEPELGDGAALGRRGALLAVSELIWQRRLGDMFDTKQVQALLSGCTRQAISDFVKRKRLLAVSDAKGRLRFPAFQFMPTGRPFPIVADVLREFSAADVSPYTTAAWFVTPQPLLDGETPAQWLRAGSAGAIVVEAARRSAARLGQ